MVQAQLTVPLWTWGAARSKVKEADLKLQQARNDLSFIQRNLLSQLGGFYREAAVARTQRWPPCASRSSRLRRQYLDLTLLRYQAGEVTVLEVVDAQNGARDAH